MPKLQVVRPFAVPDDVEQLAEDKLASSGLTRIDAKLLGMSWLTADEAEDLGLWPLPALKIPYFDPQNPDAPMAAHPKWPAFWRARALREPVPKPADFRKYLQPKDTGMSAYFPRTQPWPQIIADPAKPLIITEGELKAAKTCKEGLPTIGLGGVDSFRAIKQGVGFLPELSAIDWVRREVAVIFDSDARSNEHVCGALWRLAEELKDQGALPKVVMLPALSANQKTGLDDFLLTHHTGALHDLIEQADHLTLAQALWALNQQYAYVIDTGSVVRQDSGVIMKPDALRGHATTAEYMERRLLPNGAVTRRKIQAGGAWLSWPLRTEVGHLAYAPGRQPLSVVDHTFNLWRGWGVEPRKGDVRLFLRLIEHLFAGAEPAASQWFLRWAAWPLIHPGDKLFTSAVIWGLKQGTGKTLIGETLGRIYGANYTAITQEDLAGAFNTWARGRQLVMGDDVTSSDKRRDLDRLKKFITQTKIWINEKYQPAYEIADCINYLWTSNHADAFFLEGEDRRFFIHEVTTAPMPDAFYVEYDNWLKAGGAAAVFDHLLNLGMGDFSPSARAPDTAAKANMIRLARSDVDGWISDVLADPDAWLRMGEVKLGQDLVSLAELRMCYEAHAGRTDLTQIGFARRLAAAGVRMANGGQPVYVPGAALARYYMVRNLQRWAKAPVEQVRRYLGGIVAAKRK